MSRSQWHWRPTLKRIVRRLRPSPESFAAAAAVYSPDLMLALEATRAAVIGDSSYNLLDLELGHEHGPPDP